jgi:hypothetical protein
MYGRQVGANPLKPSSFGHFSSIARHASPQIQVNGGGQLSLAIWGAHVGASLTLASGFAAIDTVGVHRRMPVGRRLRQTCGTDRGSHALA